MSQARVLLFGLAAIYLVGVLVQFYLAGLGTFQATEFDAHRLNGYLLVVLSLAMLVLAVAGKVPRRLIAMTGLLFVLGLVQVGIGQVDVEEIAALHVVNALLVFGLALEVMHRTRRYLTSKIDA